MYLKQDITALANIGKDIPEGVGVIDSSEIHRRDNYPVVNGTPTPSLIGVTITLRLAWYASASAYLSGKRAVVEPRQYVLEIGEDASAEELAVIGMATAAGLPIVLQSLKTAHFTAAEVVEGWD